MSLYTIVEGVELVGYLPGEGAVSRVHLPSVAKQLGRDDAACRRLRPHHFRQLTGGGMEVSGRFGKRLKKAFKKVGKGIKKAAQKTLVVAHKITHNKAFEKIHKAIQDMVPKPFKALVTIHNKIAAKTHKILGKVTGDKKTFGPTATTSQAHKKIASVVADVAAGKAGLPQLKAASTKLGVDFEEAKALAAVSKLATQAKKDPRAKTTLKIMKILDNAKKEVSAGKPGAAFMKAADMAALAKKPAAKPAAPRAVRQPKVEADARKRLSSKALAWTVETNGRKFNTIVVPA